MPKPHKFPVPADYLCGDALIFCPNDRVIIIYNQHTGQSKKAMAKTVKDWFVTKAKHEGWVECWFLPIAQSPTKSAGCVLLHPARITVEHRVISIQPID